MGIIPQDEPENDKFIYTVYNSGWTFMIQLSHMKNWKINLAAAWVAQFFCIAGFNAAFPFLPFYIRELGVTELHEVELWSGALLSSAAVSMALISPVWGILADRYGRKLMVERATFGGAVVLTAMAFAGNVQQLFVLRLLQGLLSGTVPAFMTLTASFAPPSQAGFALGMMQMAVYTGSSVGPLIGGLVADHLGYRWAFAVTGILLFTGGLLVYFFVHENFVRPEKKNPSNSIAASARTIVGSLPVLGAILALGGIYMGNTTPSPLLPLLVESLQRDASRINTATGTLYGINAVASAISAALIGRLGDRKGYRQVLLACCIGAIAAYLGQALTPTLAGLFVATFMAGFCIGGLMPTANAILARMVPSGQQGAVYGISNSVNAAGRAIGPMLGASVATALGLRFGFAVAALVFVFVTVWSAMMVRPTSEPSRDGVS